MDDTTGPGLLALRPALNFAPELLLRAQGVKIAFFDVDGVLTDGGLYFSEHGPQHATQSPGQLYAVLRARLHALGITHAHFGTEDKRPAAEQTLKTLGCDWQQAAAMGDDWPDLPVMRRAALSCAPANAHAEVKAVAHHVTQSAGGHGAAREMCDLLLVASGRYAGLLAAYAA